MQQYLFTRETKVQNIVNAESYGVGIRVIANGTWGFAATSDVTTQGIAKCAETAVAIAKANAKIQKEPVNLAPQKGVGEVVWNTPIKRNAFEVPVQEKCSYSDILKLLLISTCYTSNRYWGCSL